MHNRIIFIVMVGALWFGACSDQGTNPKEEQNAQLSSEEQAQIVASQVAESNGGVMLDIHNVASTSEGNPPSLAKPAGLDTTLTLGNLTYQISLSFYTKNGQELPAYVQSQTDSILYSGKLVGEMSGGLGSLKLNSATTLGAGAILSKNVRINGTSTGGSDFNFSSAAVKTSIQAGRDFKVTNVIVPLQGGSYIPTAGTLEGTISGTYSHLGVRKQDEGDFEISFSLTFNGDETVTVTLGNGTTFTLNLKTGSISMG